jgi:predicted amidohydrolase
LSDEQLTYTAGEESLIIHYKGWNIRPIICYDLRFPVWCRNRIHHSEAYRGEYDVLFVVASWPARRELAWRTLTQARAIENMSYLVACNRIGEDIHQINHSGYSVIHDMLGEELTTAQSDDSTIYATLDLNTLIKTRRAYQFWRDADDFSFKP